MKKFVAWIAVGALVLIGGTASASIMDMADSYNFELDSDREPASDIEIEVCEWVLLKAHLIYIGAPPQPEDPHIHDVSVCFTQLDSGGNPHDPTVYIEVVEPEVFPTEPYEVILGNPLRFDWEFDPGVEPCNYMPICQWVDWGLLHVADGEYCQRFSVQIDLSFDDGSKVWSNALTFHVVPEPATLSLLILGGLVCLRKRR
jgi:hypothetical protein